MTQRSNDSDIGPIEPIGWVTSPLRSRHEAPKQPDEHAHAATLTLQPEIEKAATGLQSGDRVVVLTWLHQADQNTLTTRPRDDANRPETGVFATRSPDRPNPIGVHHTTITQIEGVAIDVAQLEAIDGTPILDIKPDLQPIAER